MTGLDIYYEGGTVDRHWLAPAGLGIREAKRQRQGPRYESREGARRALVARQDAEAREEHAMRRAAFEQWQASGEGCDDLTLRAAAHYAQATGDEAAERAIDDVLTVREARR